MKLLMKEVQLLNIFKTEDFRDKETNEIKSKGKFKLQVLAVETLRNGETKQRLLDISIPDAKFPQYKDKVGKQVEIEVNSFINGNNIAYYGI